MNYIYHMVPKNMKGSELHPLNELKNEYPELFERYIQKYFDHPERPKLLEKKIPKLDCLWNDVLHFLPIHPYHVYKAITDLGIKTKKEQQFYKVPIDKLQSNKTAIYLYSKEKYDGPSADIDMSEIKILNTDEYKELIELPRDTIEYYRVENEKGNRFGLFPYIPHILSLGKVNVEDVEVITWNENQNK
ncbi:group-specific protein [Bacillus salitolerans]|uniref:Group-specific protein n=1 Tax=Bacillus salitolerans TaxID=1437434 RepID=A0ABW4LUG0_9BACI